MKRIVHLSLLLVALPALDASAARAQAMAHPGLFFTLANNCGTPVSVSAGDDLCPLRVGSATYARVIFSGTLAPGPQQFAMACTGKDGLGSVRLASGTNAPVFLTVKPDQVISIPSVWCGASNAAPETPFKQSGQ